MEMVTLTIQMGVSDLLDLLDLKILKSQQTHTCLFSIASLI